MDLGEGLRKALAKLSGATIIDAKTIREFTKEMQKALISSDVDLNLVLKITNKIEEAALKQKIPQGLSPKSYITNMVYEELVSLMGETYEPQIKPKRILLAGIYGSGKTTSSAKLAKFYQDRGLGTGLICCDISRPAAYEQLKTLAEQANVGFYGEKDGKDIKSIIKNGLEALKQKKVIICDSGGRSAIDSKLIEELNAINKNFRPDEKILVLNADIGQVAGKQAAEFNKAIGITGVIVTKMDGSGRGGGALSAVSASQCKINFITTGEKLKDIEPYDSGKYIGRLLGIPDIDLLIKTVNESLAETGMGKEDVDIEKLTFDTFYKQLKAMSKMGPMKSVMGMMGLVDLPKDAVETGEKKLKIYESIISSMTEEEKNEEVQLSQSRIKRLATGSGRTEKDVRSMISDFNRMRKLINTFKNDRNLKRNFKYAAQ